MRPRRVSLPSGSELLRHAYFPAPSQAGEVTAAGAWAGIVLGSWGVTVRAGPVVAALSELVANAVAYGFSGAVGITLRLWRGPGDSRWLTVAVHDGNPAPPVLRAPKAQAPVQRGWGLLIVVVQADAHGWYPDADAGVPGKTVWFARCIHPWRPGHQHPVSPGCS